jgi:prevent-host-death family protein
MAENPEEHLPQRPARVGVRDLRQNLSVFLKRVKDGEILEVTERGEPVALLMPLASDVTSIDLLLATGQAKPASGSLDDLEWPPPGPVTDWLSKAVDEQRADKI